MTARLPSLNTLRAFEAAARHLSFKKAAKELHVTPAAISHQVKALEGYLGFQLFHRLNRGLVLTAAAQASLPKLQEGFGCLAEAVEQMQASERAGVLRVNVTPGFASKWLVPRLHRFVAGQPEIDVKISANLKLVDVQTKAQKAGIELLDVSIDDADILIRFGLGNYPGLRVDKLFSVVAAPMCSPSLQQGEYPLRQPTDLYHHVLLHDDSVYLLGGRSYWDKWLELAGVQGVDTSRGLRFNHAEMALEAAAEGLGVVLTLTALATSDLAAGRLIMPFQPYLPLDYAYYLVCPEATANCPKVAIFREWLLDEARRAAMMDRV